ncbi:pentatricopeptide repeat-containing protein 5, mitochondrial [Ceratobasidium sp. AG-Ba]|nr:pentatricopeptide repeat-containing protein 5, mitochondrial [Ceratobasidium sp. AG-Ba]QRV99444.1 pentatricopeptide repeat-containing protein 5, mitochondrial [Ceratobasidium sp. AG-Ba]QRW13952.1 PPR domain protein [Ceratobasidium sp. AG-Ba]
MQDHETPLQYSEEQLKALYDDLFASHLPPAVPRFDTLETSETTLQALHERLDLASGDRPYKEAIDRIEQALTFITTDNTHLKLGLILDSEWEPLINATLDAKDVGYAIRALQLMNKCNVDILEGLDGRILAHKWLSTHADKFAAVSDKLTEIGYPLTPERLSALVDAHLSSSNSSLESVRDVQNLIHKLEARGTPPSQSGYTSVLRAYLDLSRETGMLSNTATNPFAAIAAIHDLFTHMRYVAHPTPSLETYSLVINACSRGRDVNPLRALELLKEVKEGLIEGKPGFLQPNIDLNSLIGCYNAAIRACARAGPKFAGDAFQLARELVQRDGVAVAGAAIGKLGPDRATMSALIHSTKRTGDLGRARWILTETMRAQAHVLQKSTHPSESQVILDEEIMVCAFQVYSAFQPPFRRGTVQEKGTGDPFPSTSSQSIKRSAQLSRSTPQSPSEILFEADTLFSRVISKRSTNSDPLFTHVPLSPRILNAYLGIYLSHAPVQQALEKYSTIYRLPGMPLPNIYTFVALLERLASCSKSDRSFALSEAKKVWGDWLGWIAQADRGHLDPVVAEVTPRGIERVWAAMIKVYSLCDEIDAAVLLLREFIGKYPPANLGRSDHLAPPSPHVRLDHAPPTNLSASLSNLLEAPAPRTGTLACRAAFRP